MAKANIVSKVFDALLRRVGKIVHQCRDVYYRLKNKNRPRLLVFTDSRGYEVVKPWNRKSPYASYVGELCKQYYVDHVICPEFSTTVVDFLYEYQQRLLQGKQYDAVIAHVGVVDYSPRPVSMLDDMMQVKSNKLASLFPNTSFDFTGYHNDYFPSLYFGKPVKNFYSKAFLTEEIIPQLTAIDNLIMIGCSPVLTDWHGNYWRERPENMNMILDYSTICKEHLPQFIDYSHWSPEQIKHFTVDNIHLSHAGFCESLKQIKSQLAKLKI